MVPNPPRKVGRFWGEAGDPVFVCLVNDQAHRDAAAVRADERRRLLAETGTIRAAREQQDADARKIADAERAEGGVADAEGR